MTKKKPKITFTRNGLTYSINEDKTTVSITKSEIDEEEEEHELIIPSYVKYRKRTYAITRISELAFFFSPIKSLRFESNSQLTTIENGAISNSDLEIITIPSTVIDLQTGWCKETSHLKTIEISPDNPRYKMHDDRIMVGKSSLQKDTFDDLVFCSRDSEHVTVPSFVTTIQSYSFELCTKLKKIDFEEGSRLKKIEREAFMKSPLESLYFPACLEKLEDGWCAEMAQLSKINVCDLNQNFKEIEGEMIVGKSEVESDVFDVIVFGYKNVKSVTIPSYVKTVGSFAFSGSYELEEVIVGDDSQLETIGKEAFADSGIERFTIPHHLTEICELAFYSCRQLKRLDIPNDSELNKIGCGAFSYTGIERFTIPPHLKIISERMFLSSKLRRVDVPRESELEAIEEKAFHLTPIVRFTIPRHVTSIGKEAFYMCDNLQEVVIEDGSELRVIGKSAFSCTKIEKFTIPPKVDQIEESAFASDSLKVIEMNANPELEKIVKDALSRPDGVEIKII